MNTLWDHTTWRHKKVLVFDKVGRLWKQTSSKLERQTLDFQGEEGNPRRNFKEQWQLGLHWWCLHKEHSTNIMFAHYHSPSCSGSADNRSTLRHHAQRGTCLRASCTHRSWLPFVPENAEKTSHKTQLFPYSSSQKRKENRGCNNRKPEALLKMPTIFPLPQLIEVIQSRWLHQLQNTNW